jgi:uncharacterized protein YecT (DUF1311 family)
MMIRIAVLIVLLMAGAAKYALAQVQLSSAYSKCIERAGAVEPEITECMAAEIALQDKRLNNAYKKLIGKLTSERKKQLQEAQRLWLRYTDANCSFYYDPNGGTAARSMSNECSVQAKAARAQELEDLAKW